MGSPRRCIKTNTPNWIFIDQSNDSDLQLDLTTNFPFPSNCIKTIYSSHLLEHFYYPQPMLNFLHECNRILKPGGSFSIAVPNAQIYIDGYVKGYLDVNTYCKFNTGLSFQSKIDYINHIAYMGTHHKYMFDEENLINILIEAGFKNVKLRNFDPSIDLEHRKHQSIYAECRKA